MIDQIVTIIGGSYVEPICTLLEKLENYDQPKVGPLGSGYYINGYSASICLLSIALLESYVMRVRYINEASENEINRMPVGKYLANLYEDFPMLDEVGELFVLRDTITHNHLWELYLDRNEEEIGLSEEIRKSTGDWKYSNYVDLDLKQTKKLQFTVVPISIGRYEVITVLKNVWKVLIYLENKDLSQCPVSAQHYKYKGQMLNLGQIAEVVDRYI
ncbi:hypothetical protein [Desulfotalea psychrophila]|uniref:Uncharacterized protein n=1 Tax=Desulfotalea psychrophila (strain LSv54 / DSM 12343) TaxID=177439 RepID=Q6ALM9_DESPS|nr:hypothetical protein [Desulfotalea psychrophila]CAG36746.1 unknown protein [Desulfotalea psychrophila LSv54]